MRRPGSHTWVFVVLCSATAVTIASVTSLYAATGDIAKDLGTTQAEIAWVLDAYTLVLAGLLLPAAALGDRIGRRRVMTIGLVIFTIAAAAAQLVNTPDQLIADRAALGLGAALILPTTLSLITSTFPAELRDRSVAIWAATFSAAGGLGGALAAFLLEFFSWRSAFWSALIGAVLVLAATPTLPESREENAPRLDAAGALTATAAILLLVYGLIEAGVRGWGDDSILAAFVLSAAAFALFITIELRREHPLLDVRLFTQRALSVAFVLVMVAFSAAFAIAFLIIPYQQVVLGDGALGASLAMACMAIPVVAVTPVVGRLADRFGVRRCWPSLPLRRGRLRPAPALRSRRSMVALLHHHRVDRARARADRHPRHERHHRQPANGQAGHRLVAQPHRA